ncbi:MAG: hypothetical protein Kow00121_53310 [Elainellaceae cyanobacterium]
MSLSTMMDFCAAASFVERVYEAEPALPLRDEACRSKFFLHNHPTAKVCLFLHGFTAGPYQFEPLGRAFFEAGYNVLVPLQPGHGQAGDWSRQHPPPLPTDVRIYQQFVLEWIEIAQALGQQVVVGGLSSGAVLAAWLAIEYAELVDQALLFAPYLGSRFWIFDWLVKVLPFYFEWFNKDAPGNFGYKGFRIPALRLFLELGHHITKKAQSRTAAPLLLACSDGDRVTNRSKQQRLFKSVLAHQPRAWYYSFDKALQIRHRMLTRLEGNQHEEQVITLAKAYIDSDLTWMQLQQIADRMIQGEPYDAAVKHLNLESQVSPSLSPLMLESIAIDLFRCISLRN